MVGLPEQTTTHRWLKTTEMYPLTVLAARNLQSRYQKGHAPFEGFCEDPAWSPPSVDGLLAILQGLGL